MSIHGNDDLVLFGPLGRHWGKKFLQDMSDSDLKRKGMSGIVDIKELVGLEQFFETNKYKNWKERLSKYFLIDFQFTKSINKLKKLIDEEKNTQKKKKLSLQLSFIIDMQGDLSSELWEFGFDSISDFRKKYKLRWVKLGFGILLISMGFLSLLYAIYLFINI